MRKVYHVLSGVITVNIHLEEFTLRELVQYVLVVRVGWSRR